MAIRTYKVLLFRDVEKYLESIPELERAKVYAAIHALRQNDFESVETKLIISPIRELKVKKHRLFFFIVQDHLYFVSGFLKKTQKTPKYEISKAQKIYREFR